MVHERKLDALRGIASLVVLFAHAAQVFVWRLVGEDSTLAVIAENAARHAVLVFFLLSGYLITQSIQSNVRRNGGFVVRDYAVARIARIYPPLIGALALTLVAGLILQAVGATSIGVPGDLYAVRESYQAGLSEAVSALLLHDRAMEQANGPLWSLYMECHLYVIGAFAALAATGRARWLSAAVAVGLFWHWNNAVVDFGLFAAVWAMGAGLALAGRVKFAGWIAAGVALGMTLGAWVDPAWLGYRNPVAVLGFCVLYAYAIFLRPEGANPPRWMVASAGYSYSLYVIHFPLLLGTLALTQGWLGVSLPRTLAVAALASAGCIFAAYWLARVLEDQARFKPMIRALLGGGVDLGRRVEVGGGQLAPDKPNQPVELPERSDLIVSRLAGKG